MATKGIVGRATSFSGVEDRVVSTRLKPHDDGGTFTVAATAYDHNVSSTNGFFRSDRPTDSTYNATLGYDGGYRHFVRIKADNDFFLKFDSISNKSHKIEAGDTPIELVVRECNNIFLRSAGTTTAQVQRIDTVADSSGSLNNKYFYIYASSTATGYEETIGVWLNVNSAGTQPTDSLVTQWVPVAIATNETANNVAVAVEAAIEAILVPVSTGADAFSSSVSTNQVTVTWQSANNFSGPQRNAADSTAAPTGFTFNTPSQEGTGSAVAISLFMV